ncbi:MAG: flagellar protein FlaG [Gammaproteobacteria bacterium]|nr:flagellar protein FlaG [Gammaproteobacteria bacterium]
MSTEVSHLQNLLSTSNPGSKSNSNQSSNPNPRFDSAHVSTARTPTIEQRQTLSPLGQEMAAELQKKEELAEGVVVSGLAEATDFVNNQVQTYARNLEFSVEEETGEMIVRVYDSETEELVRQIPSEDMVELVRRLQQQHEASSQPIEGLLLKVTV